MLLVTRKQTYPDQLTNGQEKDGNFKRWKKKKKEQPKEESKF